MRPALRGRVIDELHHIVRHGDPSSLASKVWRIDIGEFVEWVKERSHLTRGVTVGTMMRDEAFHFTRIGTFLERADSTARILTAHQNDLIPGADAGVVPDPYEWSVLLRALSAFEIYRRVYRDVITPFKVAQLLILRDNMPRSLLRCCKEVYQNLKSVANEQSAEANLARVYDKAPTVLTRRLTPGTEGPARRRAPSSGHSYVTA